MNAHRIMLSLSHTNDGLNWDTPNTKTNTKKMQFKHRQKFVVERRKKKKLISLPYRVAANNYERANNSALP